MLTFDYSANRTFAQVHQDPNRFLFIRGPVGSGKSSGAIWHCVLNSLLQHVQYDGVRRSRYAILRASYPALKSTVIKSWQDWFKTMVDIVYDVPIRGHMRFPHPDGRTLVDVELVYIALDRDEDVNKLQSLELTGAHMNETAEQPRAVHQMLKSRINRYPKRDKDNPTRSGAVNPFIICDYNSIPSDHWLYSIAEEEKPGKHSFYSQPSALIMVDSGTSPIVDLEGNSYVVNPDADNIENLDPDYYVDQVYGAGADWVDVMIMNNYGHVRSGRPVYSDYQDNMHYSEKLLGPNKGQKIIIGMDLGLTPAAAFTQLTPLGKLNVFDEIITEDCSIRRFCEDLLIPHLRINYPEWNYEIIVDPSAIIRGQNDAKSAGQVIQDCGLNYRCAKSNDPMKRREAVTTFLRKVGGFCIGPKAQILRKGFISEFKYPKKRQSILSVRTTNKELFQERWEKNIFSHGHEALQYAALEYTEGRTGKRNRTHHPDQPKSYSNPADSSAGY